MFILALPSQIVDRILPCPPGYACRSLSARFALVTQYRTGSGWHASNWVGGRHIIDPVIPAELRGRDYQVLITPAGSFVPNPGNLFLSCSAWSNRDVYTFENYENSTKGESAADSLAGHEIPRTALVTVKITAWVGDFDSWNTRGVPNRDSPNCL